MKRFLTLIVTAVGCILGSVAQIATQTVSVDLRPGWVAPTNRFLRADENGHRENSAVISPHIRWSFTLDPESRLGRNYPNVYQGIGVNYNQFLPDATLGHPLGLYIFQGAKIASLSQRLSLNYEWNFGIAGPWKKYDRDSNPANGAIGSHVTALINLGVMLSYRLSPTLSVNAGIEATHYSNGNTRIPNAGVNTIGARIGLAYTFQGTNEDVITTPDPFTPWLGYDLTLYGATKQKSIIDGNTGTEYRIPGDFGVFGLNFAPMWAFCRYFRAGVSADFQYDESANLYLNWVPDSPVDDAHFYYQPFKQRFSAGLSLRAELTMPIFSINVGLGRNLIASGADTRIFYQTLALKAYVFRGSYLQVGYQMRDFHLPNNLMLGIGYTFGRP